MDKRRDMMKKMVGGVKGAAASLGQSMAEKFKSIGKPDMPKFGKIQEKMKSVKPSIGDKATKMKRAVKKVMPKPKPVSPDTNMMRPFPDGYKPVTPNPSVKKPFDPSSVTREQIQKKLQDSGYNPRKKI